jgi:hypothetical protein
MLPKYLFNFRDIYTNLNPWLPLPARCLFHCSIGTIILVLLLAPSRMVGKTNRARSRCRILCRLGRKNKQSSQYNYSRWRRCRILRRLGRNPRSWVVTNCSLFRLGQDSFVSYFRIFAVRKADFYKFVQELLTGKCALHSRVCCINKLPSLLSYPSLFFMAVFMIWTNALCSLS